jgi:uncharacterized protein (TIGR02246 family)
MPKRLLVVAVLAIASALAACAPSPPPPAQPAVAKLDVVAEVQAIRDADARWLKAAQAGDAAGEGAVFASDGVAYREHVEPIVGPAAFQAFATRFRGDNPKLKTSWTTHAVVVAGAGDLAVQTGEYHITGLGAKGEREDRGRFVTVWKKVNGEWKVAHDIGSTTMPEAAPQK